MRSIASPIGTKNAADTANALPDESVAAIRPASAGPIARATLNATAFNATALGNSLRPTSSLMLDCCAGW